MTLTHAWHWLKRIHARTEAADLFMIAAGMAFYGFLAIFPAVAAVIAIWGFGADPAIIREQMGVVQDFLPADAFKLVNDQVEGLLATTSRELGWTTLISTSLAIWSSRAGVSAMISGINAIHHLPTRSGLFHMVRSLVLTMTLVGIVLTAMLLTVIAPVMIRYLTFGTEQSQGLELLNFGLGLLLVVFGIALVYRLGPNRPPGANRYIFTRGLLLAVVLWALISRGFVYYLSNFHSYNEVYGSIGAVVALMMWMYLSSFVILLGAAVDAERAARPPQ